MSYILKLAGWYPSKVDAYNGDFVQRHAKSIALYEKTIVVYLVKSTLHKKITVEKSISKNLTEYIGYYPQQQYFDKLQSQFLYVKTFKQIIKKIFAKYGKPKLVHLNIVWKAGYIALYLKRKFNLPYVITENWTGYYNADPNFIGNANWFKKKLVKNVFKNALYFLPVTKNLADTCNTLFKLNLPYIVIENAVDTNLFYPIETNAKEIKLVHISTMGYQKNTDSMLYVIEKVMNNIDNDCTLKLIGPHHQEIIEIIEDSTALNFNTTLTGNIPYIEVAKYLQNASALVLYSRYENLPCVILEALCAGIPVISTSVGGIAEVINDRNGILIESEDKIALQNALKFMADNISTYNKNDISTDAINKYSYEAIGKKYQNAYNAILK